MLIDFDELLAEDPGSDIIEPVALFKSLVPRADYLKTLRGDQQQILSEWWERRAERDTVIKMNTGAGKTIVGLLIAQSTLNELGGGRAVYLCPDWALASQAAQQAKDLGVEAVLDNRGGELPRGFVNGEQILVSVFQRVFNGRSRFRLSGDSRPHISVDVMIVDDAHACLGIAQQVSTVRLKRRTEPAEALVARFASGLKQQSSGLAADVIGCKPGAYMSIPYWEWLNGLETTAAALSNLAETDTNVGFAWPIVRDDLPATTCVVGSKSIEIFPAVCPTHRFPTVSGAKRRIFMTATLVEDSQLARDFEVAPECLENTLYPRAFGDLGERMIIAPSLVDPKFGQTKLLDLINRLRGSAGGNVVVLVPSFAAAKRWEELGARKVLGEDVPAALEELRANTDRFFVFANRYDGMDLPGSACRVLIMDGLPRGTTLAEQMTAAQRAGSGAIAAQLAQRVEQGLGRAVRSDDDHAAVLLVGSDLVNFISDRSNLRLFSAETRSQIEMSLTMSRKLREAGGDVIDGLADLLSQCLKRNPKWVKYHRNKLVRSKPTPVDPVSYPLALMERTAFSHFAANADQAAAEAVKSVSSGLTLSDSDRGWYLQLQARYLHRLEPARAQEVQSHAHSFNTNLLKPLIGIRTRKGIRQSGLQAHHVHGWLTKCVDQNAVVVRLQSVTSQTAFGVEWRVAEAAFKKLGSLLGLVSSRPEKEEGNGPDVLWMSGDQPLLLLELKTEVLLSRGTISASEVGQLANHVGWSQKRYPGIAYVPCFVHPSSILAHDASPSETFYVLNKEGLPLLVEAVGRFAAALASKPPESWTVAEVDQLLKSHRLHAAGIRNRFLQVKESR